MANPTKIFLFLPPLPADKLNSYRQHHPYGPNGSGGFETDLSIEILASTTPIPFSAALAACSSVIRCIPFGDTGAILVLQPTPKEKKDILSTLGMSGLFVFVYRNLTKSSVAAEATRIIQALGTKGFPSDKTPQQLGQLFAEGGFWLKVAAGTSIGEADTLNGTQGWARMGFEIVFIPGGINPRGNEANIPNIPSAWLRLQQLVATLARTRRLDPMAFYAAIARGEGPAKLDASHANHILLTLPTRRTLIEVRDEYDRPYTDPVTIKIGSGAPVTAPPPAGSRGTFVVDTVPPGGQPGALPYVVSIPRQIFTDLPSGNEALSAPSKTLTTPSHWSTQTIFMDENPANIVEEIKSWFVPNTDQLPRFTRKNKVTVFRDGVETFRAYKEAIDTISGENHFLELAGWILIDDFELVHGDENSTFEMLCLTVADKGAQVRALLWDDSTLMGNNNSGAVDRINALPDGMGRAILDDEAPGITGSHHQKMLLVNGAPHAVAFCGGIDINSDRRDSHKHGAHGGFHDVHAKFEGPAVNNLHRNFFRRWNSNPDHTTTLPEGDLNVALNPGTVFVEIARTFSPAYTNQGFGHYPFVSPRGSLTPYLLLRRAIQHAQKYIYIEDQYFTPYPGTNPSNPFDDTFHILSDLRAALERIDHLFIVIPNHSDQPQNRYRRQQAIQSLKAKAPEKVHVFYLARDNEGNNPAPDETGEDGGGDGNSGGEGHRDEIYCHSKVWMVDDVVAKIGSANMSRRSYSSDTELDAVMCDEALDSGARRFVKQFRMDLWGEHLQLLGGQRALLEDIDHAMTFFLDPPPKARIRTYDHDAEIGIPLPKAQEMWDSTFDFDGRFFDLD